MRFLAAALACVALAGPALAQEKTFVLDTGTGQVSQKDLQQDAKIAALEKELADLKAKLSPAAARPDAAHKLADWERAAEMRWHSEKQTAAGYAVTLVDSLRETTGTGPDRDTAILAALQNASGVAVSAPFVQESPCGPGGCPTTPGTTVRYVAGPSSFRQAPVRYEELTYTAAPRGTSGITSGCAGGACAAPAGRTGWYPGKLLGR